VSVSTPWNKWSHRIGNARRVKSDWEARYKCDLLYDYYKNFQWKSRREWLSINYNPYTINLVYSTIKIKLANLIFQRPKFNVEPKPGNSQWNLDDAVRSAQIKEDTLNTIIRNPHMKFVRHVKLAALESFFRFGLLEVGYAADWRNPQKIDPLLKSWEDPEVSPQKDRVIDDNELPEKERFYIKRIPAKRFYVAVSEAPDLEDHDWVGYYEFYYTAALKKSEGIKWPDSTDVTNVISADFGGIVADPSIKLDSEDLKNLMLEGQVSKVWHIWDIVARKRLLLLEDSNMSELWSDDFERLPLIDIRWDFTLEGFYPIPPVFQWLSPQDEINEAREQTRSYRRRFTRKFQAVKGSVSEDELEKFASGPDGVIIETDVPDAIKAIDNPDQTVTTTNALLIAKDDFNIISGTSAEARGQDVDRATATQSKIMDARAQIRESADQLEFGEMMCSIGAEILATAQERMTLGMMIQMSENPGDDILTDYKPLAPIYQHIKAQDLADGYDYEVLMDITNATPAAMEAEKQAFITFLSLVAQFPAIAMSPILIREAAYRCGYRNERVIQQYQQAALAQQLMQQAAAAAKQQQGGPQGPGGNNAAATQVAQQAPPAAEAIQDQISKQIVQ
jgi:hypothetical protein